MPGLNRFSSWRDSARVSEQEHALTAVSNTDTEVFAGKESGSSTGGSDQNGYKEDEERQKKPQYRRVVLLLLIKKLCV